MNKNLIPTFIKGQLVDLLPLNQDHIKLYLKWENNPKTRLYSRNVLPLTFNDLKKRIESQKDGIKNNINFELWHNKDKKPIGFGEVSMINWFSRKASLGLLIGEPDYWDLKIGTETSTLLIKYAFQELNLNKLTAYIIKQNIGSWKCAEKSGFNRIAIFERDEYVNGKYVDCYFYSLFKEDWIKRLNLE